MILYVTNLEISLGISHYVSKSGIEMQSLPFLIPLYV